MLLVRLVLTTEAIHSAAKYLSSNDITFNVHTNYLTTAFQASTFFFFLSFVPGHARQLPFPA